MDHENFMYLGHIRKTFGYRGELILEVEVDDPTSFEKLESVFLDIQGARIPYFIETIKARPDQSLVVKFRNISTKEAAQKFLQCQAYIPAPLISETSQDEIQYEDLLGYHIRDVHLGDIGTLTQILEFPEQDIFSIDANGREVLVPIVEEFILEVDVDSRFILLETPEGLIDIYLSPNAEQAS